MHRALALGSVLLVVVLALDQRFPIGSGTPIELSSPDGTPERVDLVIAAKGRLLPSGRYGAGPEHYDDIMRVGDRVLSVPTRLSGLRVGWLAPDYSLQEHRNYDVATSSEDVAALALRAERAPVGSVVMVASAGRIEPLANGDGAAETRRADLFELGERLGSRVRPFDVTPCSWALLSIRVPGGWRRLAESFSLETGVVLPFTLERARGLYAEHVAETSFGAIEEDVELQLFRELERATNEKRMVQFLIVRRDEGGFAPSLAANLEGTERPEVAILRWEDVRLGAGPELRCRLAVRKARPSRDRGAVRFVLRIDGEEVADRLVEPTEPDVPRLEWTADLSAFAGEVVDLELRAEGEPCVRSRQAIWEEPVVAYHARR